MMADIISRVTQESCMQAKDECAGRQVVENGSPGSGQWKPEYGDTAPVVHNAWLVLYAPWRIRAKSYGMVQKDRASVRGNR